MYRTKDLPTFIILRKTTIFCRRRNDRLKIVSLGRQILGVAKWLRLALRVSP